MANREDGRIALVECRTQGLSICPNANSTARCNSQTATHASAFHLLRPGHMHPVSAIAGTPPLVSIITPSYDAAAYLPETIGSALTQRFTDFEVVIVDDGST